MFDKYGDKMGKILRSALTDGVLMRKILFESDVLYFFSFQAFRVRKTDIRTSTTAAKHFCGLTVNTNLTTTWSGELSLLAVTSCNFLSCSLEGVKWHSVGCHAPQRNATKETWDKYCWSIACGRRPLNLREIVGWVSFCCNVFEVNEALSMEEVQKYECIQQVFEGL